MAAVRIRFERVGARPNVRQGFREAATIMKIVVLDGFTTNPGDLSWDGLAALGDFVCYEETPDELRAERVGDAEIVLINRTPIDRATIEACPNLRCIALFATGYNGVDVAAARERGVDVLNIPHYSSMAVAQHGMALLLEIANGVARRDVEVKAGKWGEDPDYAYHDIDMVELWGLTMGVVGYGDIGRAMAGMALGMGMEVIATRRNRSVPPDDARVRYVDLDELLAASDVVSLHVPLFPETKGMIHAGSIARMKDGAILVNTSRGGLVVERDVAAALESGKLAAFGTDVTATEPVADDSPLLRAKHCFITPHIAWAPRATRRRLLDMMRANLHAFMSGTPINVVN